MPDDLNWELLDRFFAGECTPAEQAEVLRWLETHPLPAKHVAALRRGMGLDPSGDAPGDWGTDAAWARLARTTGVTPEPRAGAPLRLVGVEARRRSLAAATSWWRVAAVLILAVGSGTLWWLAGHRALPIREFATARGQRADMRLADGTRIVLSVDSKLRVPGDYGAATRDVYLEGEAYFEVVHDSTRPFAVHLAQATVRDIGTRFGVRAYAGEPGVQVVVAEGRVAFQTPARAPELDAGQLARLDAAGTLTVSDRVDASRYLAWIDGRLSFENIALRDALPELSRWYDLDLTLADSRVGERRLTFQARGEPLVHVLDGIALLVHGRYERNGRGVTFHSIEDVR